MQLNINVQFCTTSADLVRNIFLKQPFSASCRKYSVLHDVVFLLCLSSVSCFHHALCSVKFVNNDIFNYFYALSCDVLMMLRT